MPLSSAQIVADALAIAKCGGFKTQGGRALNYVLTDLVLNHNLKVNLVTSTIPVVPNSNGPFLLEPDYLRTYNLFYYINDQPYFLRPSSLDEFDSQPNKSTTSNYPFMWASDLSDNADQQPGELYIYPQSNTGLTLIHRYMIRRAEIDTPESSQVVPWFSNQDYLVDAVAARMMRITDDTRYPMFIARCESTLLAHLLTEGDEQQVVKEVQLDPKRFKFRCSLRPTKNDPY